MWAPLTKVSTPSTPGARRVLFRGGSRGSSAPVKVELNGSFTVRVGLVVSCSGESMMQQQRWERACLEGLELRLQPLIDREESSRAGKRGQVGWRPQ